MARERVPALAREFMRCRGCNVCRMRKVRDAIHLAEREGWSLVRMRGCHRQYRHPVKPGTVTIAGKPSDDLPPEHGPAS